MIKPGEYIQILSFFNENESFIEKYRTNEYHDTQDDFEVIQRFDELRCLHADYAKECDLYSIYRNLDLSKLNFLKQTIIEVCTKFKIEVSFTQSDSLEFRKGLHARYYYKNEDISNLFVFYIKRSRSYVSGL